MNKSSLLFDNFRWQLYTLPFFLIATYLVFSVEVVGDKVEFSAISILYIIADIAMVSFFVSKSDQARTTFLVGATVVFFAVFLYTYVVHKEVQYVFNQLLFVIASWKLGTKTLKPEWYPTFFTETVLVIIWLVLSVLAGVTFLFSDTLPTVTNLMQLLGIGIFGLSLSIGDDSKRISAEIWHRIGTVGVFLYTSFCLIDVWYKYSVVGELIATPFIAFFATVPIVIVSSAIDFGIDMQK